MRRSQAYKASTYLLKSCVAIRAKTSYPVRQYRESLQLLARYACDHSQGHLQLTNVSHSKEQRSMAWPVCQERYGFLPVGLVVHTNPALMWFSFEHINHSYNHILYQSIDYMLHCSTCTSQQRFTTFVLCFYLKTPNCSGSASQCHDYGKSTRSCMRNYTAGN